MTILVPNVKESDSPYVFTNGYKKFTEKTGYQALDHAHGPADTCDWWRASLHDQNDKLVDCGFAGIHPITCRQTFGCCYDLSAPIPSGSGCFVKMNLNNKEFKVWPSLRQGKIVQGRKALAGPTAIDFDASARNDVRIPEAPWMSNSKSGWTIDFWMAPKDRAFYMTQNKYPGKEANLLSFYEGGKPVLHVVQQKYERECWQCGNAVVGGEVRVDVLPMLKNSARATTSHKGPLCKTDKCESKVQCKAGELPVACSNIHTHGTSIAGIAWKGSAPNYECVAQGSSKAYATAKVDCIKSSNEKWRRFVVNS